MRPQFSQCYLVEIQNLWTKRNIVAYQHCLTEHRTCFNVLMYSASLIINICSMPKWYYKHVKSENVKMQTMKNRALSWIQNNFNIARTYFNSFYGWNEIIILQIYVRSCFQYNISKRDKWRYLCTIASYWGAYILFKYLNVHKYYTNCSCFVLEKECLVINLKGMSSTSLSYLQITHHMPVYVVVEVVCIYTIITRNGTNWWLCDTLLHN